MIQSNKHSLGWSEYLLESPKVRTQSSCYHLLVLNCILTGAPKEPIAKYDVNSFSLKELHSTYLARRNRKRFYRKSSVLIPVGTRHPRLLMLTQRLV